MKAKLLMREKHIMEDGSILELVLWQLPKKEKDRSHAYKYRLYYGDSKGNNLVRYDNESGKGDHKHIGNKELPYEFINQDTLIKDFQKDIKRCSSKRGDNNDRTTPNND